MDLVVGEIWVRSQGGAERFTRGVKGSGGSEGLLMLLRTTDFRAYDSVAEKFVRAFWCA